MPAKHALIAAAFGVCALDAAFALGAPITFTGGSGNLQATAIFDVVGNDLKVRLVNSANSDVGVPADVLLGLFWDMPGNPSLTPVSAFLAPGSTAVNGTIPGNELGGSWAFRDDLTGAPGGAQFGIGGAGYDLFGPPDLFPGADPDPNPGPNGMSYGLVSAGDNVSTGNSPILTNIFVKNAADFTITGLPPGFNLNSISNVRVQYGTDLEEEPSFEILIPEPGSTMLAAGVAVFGLARRRRKD